MIESGARLGVYEVVSPLGAGGMGEVYRARDTRLNRDVAVKVLGGAFAGDVSRRARFEHEARSVAALNHPGILALYDVGVHDGVTFMVTELVDGEPLRDARLSPRKALEVRGRVRDPCAVDSRRASHARRAAARARPGCLLVGRWRVDLVRGRARDVAEGAKPRW